jgi:hypothetical protein
MARGVMRSKQKKKERPAQRAAQRKKVRPAKKGVGTPKKKIKTMSVPRGSWVVGAAWDALHEREKYKG